MMRRLAVGRLLHGVDLSVVCVFSGRCEVVGNGEDAMNAVGVGADGSSFLCI